MVWFIIVMLCLVVVFGYMSKFRCFTSYTGDIDKARNEYEKWKKFYEKSTNNKIELLDVENRGYYTNFYYRIKNNPQK